MNKNLASSKKVLALSRCAARKETNGPLLLRGTTRAGGEEEEEEQQQQQRHDEQHQQQQKQRSDQRTLRITRTPRPEASRREIRVRGCEDERERRVRWENHIPAVYQSWEFRVASSSSSSRRKRRPPRCEEN